MINFFRKYHKWLGIISVIFLILISLSGIVLNHRHLLSGIDISRNFMPSQYRYKNWNNSSVKSTIKLKDGSILIYGNIGVWKTDSAFAHFTSLNKGFSKGADNHKVCKVFQDNKGRLFAGTLFGLYILNNGKWQKINLPVKEKHIVDISKTKNAYAVLTRSNVLLTSDFNNFKIIQLKPFDSYNNKIGLFKTLWLIHSGEIWGEAGKIIVDFIGLIFIFLSITGIIIFFRPKIIKRKKNKGNDISSAKRVSFWSLKWHNKLGWTTAVFLIITTITGMFLRPPLLIPIANSMVKKIPFTKLDTPNPWFDKLRRLEYNKLTDSYFLATIDGIYNIKSNLYNTPQYALNQPPVSMMGVNVFKFEDDKNLLVGSFNGLYRWNIIAGTYNNVIPQIKKEKHRNFLSQNLVAGYSNHYAKGNLYFDYNSGVHFINNDTPKIKMPESIKNTGISLWNVALEFHTGRIYEGVLGGLYILVVPVGGLTNLFILISGFIVWYKRYRR